MDKWMMGATMFFFPSIGLGSFALLAAGREYILYLYVNRVQLCMLCYLSACLWTWKRPTNH